MKKKSYMQPVVFFLTLLALASFYVFARFTVDDAFITWRYGKNFIESGIWGYNPTSFDLTQAYTNPIMAVLSLIPAYLHIDVVLFFKCVAILFILLLLISLLATATNKWLIAGLYLAFLALPATMLHAFAGLETFLYVGLMGLLFISLARANIAAATLLSSVLLLVRPETWLLIALVPTYFLQHSLRHRFYHRMDVRKIKPAILCFLLLTSCFAVYAFFHQHYFGYILPNTFYIKSGAPFQAESAAKYGFFLVPALILLAIKRYSLFAFILLFFAPVIYSYASSDLQMDYAQRFAFHIFSPIYILLAYLCATEVRRQVLITGATLISLCAFAAISSYPPGLLSLANYYPRTLNSHAALGKKIAEIHDKYSIERFALSDAGMAAYNANIIAFDNTGLGSTLVAHHGVTEEVIDQYHPDIVVLRANADGVVLSSDNKKKLFQWAKKANYRALCDIYWNPNYKLRIFAANDIKEFTPVCEQSETTNNVPERIYFVTHNLVPPWNFWHI